LRSDAARLRRAHGRPRPRHRPRDPAAAPDAQRRPRQDHRDGHPRPEGRRVRAPPPAPGQGNARGHQRPRPVVRYLPLLWAQLFRKKTRTVLTVLSVLVAFLLFGLLEAVQVAFESGAGSVAAKRLADRYGWKVGQRLPIASEIHAKSDGSLNWEFDLVGIFDAEDPAVRANTEVVLINVAQFDEARQFGKGKTGWYIIRIADVNQAKAVSADIDRTFMNSPDETKTAPEKEFALGFAKQIGDMGALVTRILLAVFFTILILTGN